MMLAWDGSHYWEVSGGGAGGTREAELTPSGAPVSTFAPGLDFRSIFLASGALYARTYASPTIYTQTAPGVFSSSGTLAGTYLTSEPDGAQVGIVLNGAGTAYVGQDTGTVGIWNLSGAFTGTLTLKGYGTVTGETSYPQDCRIAALGPYYLTYSNGNLSAWDGSGNRVDQTTLTGAGTSFDSNFSLSYANGYVWVVDVAGGTWRGYQVGTPSAPTSVPTLSGWVLGLVAILLVGAGALMLRPRYA